jgi:hypothetical protein
MLKKNDVRGFAFYAIQECGLNSENLQSVVQHTERELHRYNIDEYRPIPAFQKTVLINGKLVSVSVCRWFFVSLVDFYLKNGIPIPENVAAYLRGVLRPMIISKLRKYQKYDFLITEQRIDESVCYSFELMFNAVDGTKFLIPENYSYENGKILVNGILCNCGVDSLVNLESAKLAGDWICLYKRNNEKLPKLSTMPRLNIVRSAVSMACRKFVEMSIGRNIERGQSTFEITDSENRLSGLSTRPENRIVEYPIHEFLRDENTSVFYRAVIYAETLKCTQDEKFSAASEFCKTTINRMRYYRLLKKAKKVAKKFYRNIIATEN